MRLAHVPIGYSMTARQVGARHEVFPHFRDVNVARWLRPRTLTLPLRSQAETNLYDLVHDATHRGAGRSAAIAAAALQATDVGQSGVQLHRTALIGLRQPDPASRLVPLGAARGTPPDKDFATQFTGAWQLECMAKSPGDRHRP